MFSILFERVLKLYSTEALKFEPVLFSNRSQSKAHKTTGKLISFDELVLFVGVSTKGTS